MVFDPQHSSPDCVICFCWRFCYCDFLFGIGRGLQRWVTEPQQLRRYSSSFLDTTALISDLMIIRQLVLGSWVSSYLLRNEYTNYEFINIVVNAKTVVHKHRLRVNGKLHDTKILVHARSILALPHSICLSIFNRFSPR
jgi:hypothetical protein